jgi:uncharacterized protein
MKINIFELKKNPASKIDVDEDADLNLEELTFVGPAHLHARLSNASSRILLRGKLSGKVELICSRCAEPFIEPVDAPLDEEFLASTSPEVPKVADPWSDLNVYDDDVNDLELDEVLRQNVLATLPIQPLCQEDCKGLCPICGGNKNQRDCDCRETSIDPRLQPLAQLQAKFHKNN